MTRDELLILLIEECGEVIQAATKCLRFGFDVDHGTGYGNNRIALSKECGELRAIIHALPLDPAAEMHAFSGKIERAETAKARYGSGDASTNGLQDAPETVKR